MKYFLKKSFLILSIVSSFALNASQDKNVDYIIDNSNKDFGSTKIEAYTPEIRQSIKKLYQQKIGLFIHWGAYSQLEGHWKDKYVSAEWIMKRAPISIKDYEQEAAGKLNPVKFKAENWVKLAKDAGMGFMVITAKHHDGFAMFDSKHPYNIINMSPFKRDPMKELAVASEKAGLGFGFYYSQSQDWHEEGAVGNDWDFPKKQPPGAFDKYFKAKVVPQIEELTSNYGKLSMIWFDTPVRMSPQHAETLMDIVAKNQPSALINSRLGKGYGHFETAIDNGKSPSVYTKNWLSDLKIPWQTHGSVSSGWGFVRGKGDRDRSKDHPDFIYNLSHIVGNGGVYLLNIAPRPDGTIPQAQIDSIMAVGDFLKVNGEAIYDADPGPYKYPPFPITSKKGKLYLHLKDMPKNSVNMQGLLTKVTKAYNLADKEKKALSFTQNKGVLNVSLPTSYVDNKYPGVIVLEIDSDKAQVFDETIVAQADGTLELPVAKSEFSSLRIGYNPKKKVTHRWGETNNNRDIIWTIRLNEPAAFNIITEQTGDNKITYVVHSNEQRVTIDAKGYKEMTRKQANGTLTFDKPGTYVIKASPVKTSKNKSFEFKGITLVPTE
jgi:alpha-L-fucosidase